MRLFKISQTANTGYDTYDSAVICCGDDVQPQSFHPDGYCRWVNMQWEYASGGRFYHSSWVTPDQVIVEYLGEAGGNVPAGVVLASFNAG